MSLLDIHREIIQSCDRVMSKWRVRSDSPDGLVLTAIGLQQLHQAKALQRLAETGFHDAGEPLVRAMSCDAVTILVIADKDSGPRAAAYLGFAQATLYKWVKNLVGHGNLSEEAAKRIGEGAAESWTRILDHYAKQGSKPQRIGANPGYWAGVTDRELFQAAGKEDWWAQYYAPFSDSAHGSVSSIQSALRLASVGRLDSGARDQDGLLVLAASSDLLIQAFAVLNRHFGNDTGDLFEDLNRRFNEAMGRSAEREAHSDDRKPEETTQAAPRMSLPRIRNSKSGTRSRRQVFGS